MTRRIIPVVVATFLFASCASQKDVDQQAFDKAPLFGMIYDQDNQPCPGVQLIVDDAPGPITDIRGRFVVPDLLQGDHRIVARKAGYEDISATVSFLNRTDVLHLTMVSFTQLLDMAQKSLADTRWDDARAFLNRAEKLDAGDPVLRYLYAILHYKTGDYAGAVGYLSEILDGGAPQPAVYLFLADIYQNDLNDPGKAISNLENYLKLRADPDVEKRLASLKEAQGREGK